MIKNYWLFLILFMPMGMIYAQPQVTVTIQESLGGCGLQTNCDMGTICVDIVMSVNQAKTLDSYNIWVEYDGSVISREAFGVNNNQAIGDNTCVIANGVQDTDLEGPPFNPDHWRVAGVPGNGFPMAANTPYTVHTMCFMILQPSLLNGQQICVGGNVSTLLTTVTFTDATSDIDVPETCMTLDGTFSSCSILPVELLDFTVKEVDNTALLEWTVASEENSDYFDIQRAGPDKNFYSIGSVKAAGNSTHLNRYQYVDYSPEQGINYYLLRIVDRDGRFSKSPIRSATFDVSNEISIYPNPATDYLYVNSGRDDHRDDATFTFEILNNFGKLLQSGEGMFNGGKIDLKPLVNGAYTIKIISGSGLSSHSFVKLQ